MMDEVREFLERLDREALSICEPEMIRGQWNGKYDTLSTSEVLRRFSAERKAD